ncbi:hypothetical protein EDD85DRAFT_788969 [Armillaria nabsnona]|nr:hypothetical protein EDD85DRAFT_788969 [Armillaria nabsnona]
MSVAAQDALQALLASIKNLTVTKYFSVSAMTILLWDILVTFDDEIDLHTDKASVVHQKVHWEILVLIPPILFTFDLYCASISYPDQLHPAPNVEFCKHAFLPPNILGIITLGTVQFRHCYDDYHLRILVPALDRVLGLMFTPLVEPDQIPEIVGCLPQCTESLCRRLLTAFWIPFFVCETLSGLRYRSNLIVVVFRDAYNLTRIHLLYRYHGMMENLAISLANLVVWIAAPISLSYVATSLMRCLQVTVCSRLLLNIRGMLDPDYGSTSMSSVAFKARSRVIEENTQNESYQLSERHQNMTVDISGDEP